MQLSLSARRVFLAAVVALLHVPFADALAQSAIVDDAESFDRMRARAIQTHGVDLDVVEAVNLSVGTMREMQRVQDAFAKLAPLGSKGLDKRVSLETEYQLCRTVWRGQFRRLVNVCGFEARMKSCADDSRCRLPAIDAEHAAAILDVHVHYVQGYAYDCLRGAISAAHARTAPSR